MEMTVDSAGVRESKIKSRTAAHKDRARSHVDNLWLRRNCQPVCQRVCCDWLIDFSVEGQRAACASSFSRAYLSSLLPCLCRELSPPTSWNALSSTAARAWQGAQTCSRTEMRGESGWADHCWTQGMASNDAACGEKRTSRLWAVSQDWSGVCKCCANMVQFGVFTPRDFLNGTGNREHLNTLAVWTKIMFCRENVKCVIGKKSLQLLLIFIQKTGVWG